MTDATHCALAACGLYALDMFTPALEPFSTIVCCIWMFNACCWELM